jgi:hypothetical protein
MARNGCSALILMVCVCLTPAHADFLISFDPNTFISSGGSGYVNVYISSDAVGGQTLNNTNFEFALSTAGTTRLEFTNSPSPSADPTFANGNYVFAGDSGAQANNLPLGTASTNTVPNDRFIGGDFTQSGSNVLVTTAAQLLAMLPVTAVTGLPPVGGDTFTISLVPASGSGFSGNTGFGDSSNGFFPFTSAAGTITITPEPSALVLVGAGVGLALLVGRRRSRSCKAAP